MKDETRVDRIKGLPLTELSITAVATFVDTYLDDDGNERASFEMEVINQADWDVFNAPKSQACRCSLCGHSLKIACAVTHKPTGNGYWIGRDCAAKINELQRFGAIIKGATVALAQRIACDKREADFISEHPDVIGILTWSKRPNAPRISRDICEKLRRFGSISDKQIALLEKIRQQDIDRRAKATGKATDGRQTIKGKVMKVTVEESEFGGSRWHKPPTYAKVIVDLGNGVRLMGKLPEHMDLDERTVVRAESFNKVGHQVETHTIIRKDDVIELSATVAQSQKDDLFGFWKRPTKFQIVELAPPPPAPVPVVDPLAADRALFIRVAIDMQLLGDLDANLHATRRGEPDKRVELLWQAAERYSLTPEQAGRFVNAVINNKLVV